MKGVGVTGMGIISAIGETVDQNYSSLIHLKNGISRVENIDTIHRDVIKVGEIKKTNQELANYLNLPSGHNFPRTSV
jgi:3-oxoacyl-(acyl-carrier-protein) synthase